MCNDVKIYYYSSNVSGRRQIYRCNLLPLGVAIPQGHEPTMRKQRLERDPLPDFSPADLLAGGLFLDNPGILQRAEILIHPEYIKYTKKESLEYAEGIWQRAESDLANTGRLDYFSSQLPAEGASDVTHAAVQGVLRFLRCSFWHQVIEKNESPSQFRRMLINQLLEYQIEDYFSQGPRVYQLREITKSHRGAILRGMMKYPDITTLPSEDRNCVICREKYGVPSEEGVVESAAKTECNHIWGDQCLSCWITDHETCPMCRTVLLSWEEGEERYLEEARTARNSTKLPDWILNYSGLNAAYFEGIAERTNAYDKIMAHDLGIPNDGEDNPDFHAAWIFGFR